MSNYQSVGLLLMILPGMLHMLSSLSCSLLTTQYFLSQIVVWCLIVGAYYLHRVWRERRNARARSERSVNLPITKYQPLNSSINSARACTNEVSCLTYFLFFIFLFYLLLSRWLMHALCCEFLCYCAELCNLSG